MTATTTNPILSSATLIHSYHAYQGYIDLTQTYGLRDDRLYMLMEIGSQLRFWLGTAHLRLCTQEEEDSHFDAEKAYIKWREAGRPDETVEGEHYDALHKAADPFLARYEAWLADLPTFLQKYEMTY